MTARAAAQLALVAMVGLAASAASAQEAKKPAPNPVGAGSGWGHTVSKETAVAGEEFDKKQIELIQKINVYFNQMPDIKGIFVQTNADNKRAKGKFYVKRPGRFRFDYAPPSRLVILSDSQYLIIQDYDLKTDNRYSLDETPFRFLLRKDVDLLRDARVTELQDIDDVIALALQDKNADTPGRIKIYLAKRPALELKEWITTDSQGLDTRVELTEVTKADDLDPNLFKPAPMTLDRIQ
jgi:outer membrane lipoprotein-sorting protein